MAAYPGEVRRVTWEAFGPYPVYALASERMGKGHWVDAASERVEPLDLTEEQVREVVERVHGTADPIRIEWMDRYDSYYLPKKYRVPLPVWKVTIDDADRSAYYVNPSRGTSRYLNRAGRWQHWAYPALHSLQLPFLAERPWLRVGVMWVLLLGGTFVSLSGVYLSARCVVRWARKAFSRRG